MLSVIIPTHNEEKRITPTLRLLSDFLEKKYPAYEIIVVDDGTDATAEIVKKIGKHDGKIRRLHFPRRLGKGGAIMQGMRTARGDAVIYDADSSVPAHEIPKLVEGLGKADVAVGSRKLPGSVVRGLPFERKVTSAAFSLLTRILFNTGVRDTQCGFKAIRRQASKKLLPLLVSRGFEWDVELLARAKQKGMRILEVPVEWSHRGGSTLEPKDVWKMFLGLLALRKTLAKSA